MKEPSPRVSQKKERSANSVVEARKRKGAKPAWSVRRRILWRAARRLVSVQGRGLTPAWPSRAYRMSARSMSTYPIAQMRIRGQTLKTLRSAATISIAILRRHRPDSRRASGQESGRRSAPPCQLLSHRRRAFGRKSTVLATDPCSALFLRKALNLARPWAFAHSLSDFRLCVGGCYARRRGQGIRKAGKQADREDGRQCGA